MDDDKMTAKEMSRLARWLKAHGHNDEEAIDCLDYIAGETELPDEGKENGHASAETESVT